MYVREYCNTYQKIFPNIVELGCEFIQNDIEPTDSVNLICTSTIYPDGLAKFTNLKMFSLDLSNNLFNISQLPSILTKIPTLNKLHINFCLRKNTLSTYTRAIQRLVNLKMQNNLVNLELCIHFTSATKDHPTKNTYNYRDSEVKYFKENAKIFIPNLVIFQLNEIELTYDTIPDSVALFEMVGAKSIEENALIPFIGKDVNKDVSSYLKNLKTIKLTSGSEDFFAKIATKLAITKLKTIEISCPVKQELLNSIPNYYKDISSFILYDRTNCYDIAFLKEMRHLRTLTLQIKDFKEINDLIIILRNCIFLNYLTINANHYELIKDHLIQLYEERSNSFPFVSIILTVKFDPVKYAAQTSYNKITNTFSIHILPDLAIDQSKA